MRNYIHAFLLSILTLQLHAISVKLVQKKSLAEPQSEAASPQGSCPSMFIAVLSERDSALQRSLIRKMWHEAGDGYGQVAAKFALCTGGMVSEEVNTEQSEHSDLLLMDDCEEGYTNGMLTKKVESAMKAYVKNYSHHELFMKVDDDTFVSTRRFCDLLTWRKQNDKDNAAAYFGVFAEGPRESISGNHSPIRDPESRWYEPKEKFRDELYPISAKGGPGYVLPRHLVQSIIEQGIAAANELNNEDKAVGVWVDKLVAQGLHVDIVNVPGTDGYDEHADSYKKTGSYQEYKITLHHHLTGDRIACLHELDHAKEPQKTIDHCFGKHPDAVPQCRNWCETHKDTWNRKCGWPSLVCSTCDACSVKANDTPKVLGSS